jgi:hypothetical protein
MEEALSNSEHKKQEIHPESVVIQQGKTNKKK